jgi:hypothetical protein
MLIDMIRLITVALRPSPVSFQMIIFPTGIPKPLRYADPSTSAENNKLGTTVPLMVPVSFV